VKRFALATALALAVAGCNGTSAKEPSKAAAQPGPPPGPAQHFRSRPDLRPPVVKVRVAAHDTAPGYIFLAPKMAVAQA